MELVKAENFSSALEGAANLPAVRQLVLVIGLAAAIAVAVAAVLWLQEPGYKVLYSGLAERDASQVVETLQQQGVKVKVDERTGAIQVPAAKVHEVRLLLAREGLPRGSATGLEMLQKEQEFGTSQFMENARYQHALAGELARSVMAINAVEKARVHLAMPRQSAFVRNRKEPSASVVVDLYPGRVLEKGQVAAIAHMVAASVPNMEPGRVTVVDQSGNLLSSRERTDEMAANQAQFDYTRRLEQTYSERILSLLEPLVGADGVRAQVTAEMDFSVSEQTQETYNPDLPAIRSEQTYEEYSDQPGAEGVPGALSNQPPAETTVPEQVAVGPGAAQEENSGRFTRRATVNYELDRTISHTRRMPGEIKRLSIAVVVADRQTVNDAGETVVEPRDEAEMERIRSLVREAVGYSVRRGDTVNVVSAPFAVRGEEMAPPPEPPLWEQAWVHDIAKWAFGGLLLTIVLITFLRMLGRLAAVKPQKVVTAPAGLEDDQLSAGGGEQARQLPRPARDNYEENVGTVRQLASENPKHVAQVMRTWVANDEG